MRCSHCNASNWVFPTLKALPGLGLVGGPDVIEEWLCGNCPQLIPCPGKLTWGYPAAHPRWDNLDGADIYALDTKPPPGLEGSRG